MEIGFIGLGIMGRPMAKNLLKSGYSLIVYDIVQKSMEELEKFGAKKASSIQEIAEHCEIIITMLPNGPQVKSAVLEEGGMINHMRPSSLLIDMSSISPTVTAELQSALQEKGIHMLDAPVSGAETKARNGELAIMVGGDEKDFTEALPLFQVMGGNVTLVGPSGSGSSCKLVNQIIIAITMAAVSEAFMLAKKSGCDLQKVFEAINTGFAGSTLLNATIPRILERNFTPGFTINLHKKDLMNAVDAANNFCSPIPLTRNMLQVLQELSEDGEGNSDNSAIAKYYEKLADLRYTD